MWQATVAPDQVENMAELENVETVEKKAFLSRPYSNADRIKKDEEELEEMLRVQRGETNEEETEEVEQEAEPESAEEKSFKKRYGDLRRHAQKQQEDLQNQINELKEQLSAATKKEIKPPKSDEEIGEWMEKYPDVAGIVETIAIKKAREQATELEERVTKINKMQEVVKKIHIDIDLLKYIRDITIRTRKDPQVLLGGSPRASLVLMNGAKARAAILGRDFVIPDDIVALVQHSLYHRLILKPEAELGGTNVSSVIKKMKDEMIVPI